MRYRLWLQGEALNWFGNDATRVTCLLTSTRIAIVRPKESMLWSAGAPTILSLHRMREEAEKKEVSASFLIRKHCTKVKQGTLLE